MGRQILLILPALVGGAAMAWSMHRSHFFLSELSATGFLWVVTLLGPFVFVGVVAWRTRRGFIPVALAVAPALLLIASPIACIADRFSEGCLYILMLSPIYLWAIVAVAAVLELATRRRLSSEAV